MPSIFKGTKGADTLNGSSSDDSILIGRSGKDFLRGSSQHDDILLGGRGDDTLVQTGGRDIMRGGDGDDTYIIDLTANAVTIVEEDADGGKDTVILEDGIFFFQTIPENIERFVLNAQATSVTGNSQDNIVDATNMPGVSDFGDGIELFGLGGQDKLIGSQGADLLDGGTGADTLRGGDGWDRYIVDNANDQVRENADSGYDSVQSSVNWQLSDNVESLGLVGNARNGTGNDLDNVINGNKLNNRLVGKDGDDALLGKRGKDTLKGGTGEDFLDGGAGKDILFGGTGEDVFQFSKLSDLGNTKQRADRIRDLEDGDTILLAALDGEPGTNGFQQLTWIGQDEFSGGAGEVRFEDGYLEFNLDDNADVEKYLWVGNDFSVVDGAILI